MIISAPLGAAPFVEKANTPKKNSVGATSFSIVLQRFDTTVDK